MQAIRRMIKRTELANISIPEDFGDNIEVIILPRKDDLNSEIWDWDAEDIEFTLHQHKINFESIDREYGPEDTEKWK
ncbi:MAG: hypothetical protein HQL08_12250 [Nitrospirae bacterium]|nr:hypothetical protein [Nitrospirota bacterium]